MLQIGASLTDDRNWRRKLSLGSSITIVSSFIIQANVITIVNYDRHLFIVQATGRQRRLGKWSEHSSNGFDKLKKLTVMILKHRVRVDKTFEFIKLILVLKMYYGGDLAPSSHTVGSLLIPPGWQRWLGKWSEHSSNGCDKLKILTVMILKHRVRVDKNSY
jgi:hypothetical protein